MSDWTKEYFVKNQELFLKVLEERIAQASGEVDVLLKYLREQGFKPKNILDLNCGIGRHSIELGKRGINVLGTDISPLYIKIAEKRAKEKRVENRVRFKVADMRKIASVLSGELFDGIINLWTSFGYYDDKTNDDILFQCQKLVRAEGFFALEIMNRDWLVRNFQERGFSRHKNVIVLEERNFDQNTSRIKTSWTYLVKQGKKNFLLKKEIATELRIWSLHELIEMFKRTNWKFKAAYPGFGQPKDASLILAKRLLFIAKK